MAQELIEKIHALITQKVSDANVHPYDIAELLLELRDSDENAYLEVLSQLPAELKGEVLIELPLYCQEELLETLTAHEIADLTHELDTDDAAELLRNIEEVDKKVAHEVLGYLSSSERKTLQALISYDEDQAGAYMQTELFSAHADEMIGDSIRRLKKLKAAKELDKINQVYIIDKKGVYIGTIALEDLILLGPKEFYSELVKEGLNQVAILATDSIHKVIEVAANYDMSVVPVVNAEGKLLGRITSDDIYDIIEERATEQIYNLAGVNNEAEQKESLFQIGQTRATWLGLNLITAIAASIVIGFFDTTIESIVALAILMPIVASMGGNAGTQTLTVTVRQMALGDISGEDAKDTILKEVYLSIMNGLLFALLIGLIAWGWFNIPLLGLVIAISMIINLVSAGFFGSVIPLVLQKAGIDPAVGSTVLLTTITDIVGFFSFLGLASLILL